MKYPRNKIPEEGTIFYRHPEFGVNNPKVHFLNVIGMQWHKWWHTVPHGQMFPRWFKELPEPGGDTRWHI